MRTPRFLSYLAMFSVFFLLGFSQGRNSDRLAGFLHEKVHGIPSIEQSEQSQLIQVERTPLPLPPPPSKPPAIAPTHTEPEAELSLPEGQINLLIIGVNNLKAARPQLEAIWLAIAAPGSPRLSLVSIYPGSVQGEFSAKNFDLNSTGRPAPAFLSAMQSVGVRWNGYLLIDDIALIEAVEYLNDLDVEAKARINGVLEVTGLPSPVEDSQAALEGQTSLAAALCRRSAHLSSQIDLSPLLTLFPKHARSNLKPDDLAAIWKNMRSQGSGLACEFPSLSDQAASNP